MITERNKSLPIFLVHWGNSDYLKYCINQAKFYNPKSEIILIGDRSNNKFDFVRHYHVSGYTFNARDFENNYVHLNTTVSKWYTKFWFKRWFVLNDFMKSQRYGEQFVYIDSDVLLYCDVTKEYEKFKQHALTINGERAPHCTFFSSQQVLSDFCDFMVRMYTEPDLLKILTDIHDRHVTEKKPGGVDDMTLILEFVKQYPHSVGDNSKIINDSAYEGNFSYPEGYEFDQQKKVKKIYWKEGLPYGKYLQDGAEVKFNALHFSGGAKKVMHRYYRGPNLRLSKLISELRNTIYTPLRSKIG